MDKNVFNKIVCHERTKVRKDIVKLNLSLKSDMDFDDRCKIIGSLNIKLADIKKETPNVNSIDEALVFIHSMHGKGDSSTCKKCCLYRYALETNDIRPRFGNLIHILQQEADSERKNVEQKYMPSQNDITRWALKEAVLEFYKKKNMADDFVVVEDSDDERLVTPLAPDFDVIAGLWMQKLDFLQHRDDKYALEPQEYDKAGNDLSDGMRGSAFEKQLDRYREEFMKKLKI